MVESGQDEESPAQMGGAEGTRTPDPHTASVVRYQLRHSPLPARSGVSEPSATLQGRVAAAAQGWRRPRGAPPPGRAGSGGAHLRDAEVVAERVAETEVDAVGLLYRLLGDLHALFLELGVGLVGVIGPEEQVAAGCALRDQLAHLVGGLLAHRGR